MKNKVLFFSLFLFLCFWIALPPLSLMVPGLKKRVIIKPDKLEANVLGKKIGINNEYRLGLDLKGGSHLVFLIDTSGFSEVDSSIAADASRDIIEKRINFFGVSEPQIYLLKEGKNYRVSVDIPGNQNPEEAIKQIGKTAQLDFREYDTKTVKQGTQSAQIPYFKPTELGGQYLKKASLVFDQQTGKPQVSLQFNKVGGKLFAEITKNNIQKPLAIFLDEELLTAPVVQQAIKDGQAVISGDFKVEEAKMLINSLNAGALPAPIKLIEQKTIEATLGEENVRQSLVAGVLGLLCVAFFMIIIYKKEGLVAIASLLVYAIISLALYKVLGIVLTISGIAGFLLSIGMAVDANILIYERIKEEKLLLKDERIAVRSGFFRALSAIKSANFNTLLVCFILFNPLNFDFLPGFGSVRGFSLTLALGVLLGLFTGVFVTKNILWRIYKI
jgi:preprotein translocase subunit SecD